MEKHRDFLKKHCRLCSKNLKRNGREYGKKLFEAVRSEKVLLLQEFHPARKTFQKGKTRGGPGQQRY
jgi:hypothetical protein